MIVATGTKDSAGRKRIVAVLPRKQTGRPKKFMLTNTRAISGHPRPKWDQRCLLVIGFPTSLPAEVRRTARFAEAGRGVRQTRVRFAPHRALDFLLHTSVWSVSSGFLPSHQGKGGAPQLVRDALKV